jgi:hypothetical protein
MASLRFWLFRAARDLAKGKRKRRRITEVSSLTRDPTLHSSSAIHKAQIPRSNRQIGLRRTALPARARRPNGGRRTITEKLGA